MHIKVQYPDAVWNIKDVRLAVEAGDKVGARLEADLEELDNNIAITTSEESGIARREKILKINPPDTATLEERRLEVLLRWFQVPIYTETTLRRTLDAALTPERYTLQIDLDGKVVRCRILWMSKKVLKSMRDLFEKMVPLDYGLSVLLLDIIDILAKQNITYRPGLICTMGVTARGMENLGYKRILLDGSRSLDGSWKLSGYEQDTTFRFYQMGCCYNIPIRTTHSLGLQEQHRLQLVQDTQAGSSMGLAVQTECKQDIKPEAAVCAGAKTEISYGAEIEVRKNLWRMDGMVHLDGTRKLNADNYVIKL